MSSPLYLISATPFVIDSRLVDIGSAELERILRSPKDNRESGWNMDFPRRTIKRASNKITRGDDDYSHVSVFSNGHMELVAMGSETFFWPQREAEYSVSPRLNPYALCEFPVTFLRSYRSLVDVCNLNGPFIVKVGLRGLKNVRLYPGRPADVFYGSSFFGVGLLKDEDIKLEPLRVADDFVPDEIALKLLAEIYREFGYGEDSIPFLNSGSRIFDFGH